MTSNEKKATLLSLLDNWEDEVVEFKSGGKGFSSDEIGKYFSALSNEANLRGLEAAWLVFGVHNKTRKTIGTELIDYIGKSGEVTEKVTEKSGEVTEKVTEKLSETDERIIALIQSNPHITQKMLSEAIGLTRPYIGRKLLELQVRNIIRRIGPDKGGYWEVLGSVNN